MVHFPCVEQPKLHRVQHTWKGPPFCGSSSKETYPNIVELHFWALVQLLLRGSRHEVQATGGPHSEGIVQGATQDCHTHHPQPCGHPLVLALGEHHGDGVALAAELTAAPACCPVHTTGAGVPQGTNGPAPCSTCRR
jgi:hypothetical protein